MEWIVFSGMDSVYLKLNSSLEVSKHRITAEELFGLKQMSAYLRYKFESSFGPYQTLLDTDVPGIDLVTYDRSVDPLGRPVRGLEIKLTALPDNTTAKLPEDRYGCEIVVRPDTIIYLALSIAVAYEQEKDKLHEMLKPVCDEISDWGERRQVRPRLPAMREALNNIMLSKLDSQEPLVLQPVWRTIGQKLRLAEQCFDLFVWSNFAFTRLFINSKISLKGEDIGGPARTIIWLTKMLYDFATAGEIKARTVIELAYSGRKNDKAFSVTGIVTQPLMACAELRTPRVPREAVREIIQGGGQEYLQPERRLDAAILTTPGLFPEQITHNDKNLPAVLDEPLEADP